MGKPGLRKVHRYSTEFKLTAVKLSQMPEVEVQTVARALDIHPFMLAVAEGSPGRNGQGLDTAYRHCGPRALRQGLPEAARQEERAPANSVAGEVERRDCLVAFDGRELAEELVQGFAAFQVVK